MLLYLEWLKLRYVTVQFSLFVPVTRPNPIDIGEVNVYKDSLSVYFVNDSETL